MEIQASRPFWPKWLVPRSAIEAHAAHAGFAEDRLGAIEPGKLAEITVIHTILGKRVVWSAAGP